MTQPQPRKTVSDIFREHGRALTLCSETGRTRPYVVCGHPVPGGTYCGHEGRDGCPHHG